MKLSLLLLLFLSACGGTTKHELPAEASLSVSGFDLERDLMDFSDKMSEGDTVIIYADLSICGWQGGDRTLLRKKDGALYYSSFYYDETTVIGQELQEVEYQFQGTDTFTFEHFFCYLEVHGGRDLGHYNSDFSIYYNDNKIHFYIDGIVPTMRAQSYYNRVKARIHPECLRYNYYTADIVR